ncbi:unnamed protein product [Cunninghamella blakesleeana]
MKDEIAHDRPGGAFEFSGLNHELETIQHGPPSIQHQKQPMHHHSEADWSGDFMNHAITHSSPQQHQDFESAFQLNNNNNQSMAGPSSQNQQYQPSNMMYHQRYQYMQRQMPLNTWNQGFMHHQPTQAAITQNESAAFERAFDAAKQDAEANWEKEFAAKEDWASEFAEQEKGNEEKDATNNDALARTAAMLLDSVDINENPKFKNSQFMGLMQKLRDRTVHVEGDKMVETGKSASGDWSTEFNKDHFQTASARDQRQNEQPMDARNKDWIDDFLPHTGSEQSGNMWSTDFAKKMERGWTEQFQDQASTSQSQDLTEEEMQRLYGRGTELDDWVQQYQRNISHLKNAQDAEWEGMQKDWEKFKGSEETGYRALNPDYDTYTFTTNNPYLMHQDNINQAQQNSLTDSILALEAKAQLETNNAEAWQALGLKQQENERDGAAIAALRKAVTLNPKLLDGWLALAVSYTNENCRADAYDSLAQWLANNPTYQHLVYQSSVSKLQSKMSDHDRHSEITNLFLEAARSSPGAEMDADVQVGLGILFNVSEEYHKAIDCFKAAVASKPHDYLLWNKLGATLANSKDTTGAIDAYFNALEINPSYVRARYNLAISCINLNQYKEAAEHLLTALALQQQDDMGHAASLTSDPLVDSNGIPIAVPSGMSENVWDSLRMVMFMMKREDLAVQCDRRNIDVFRSEFDF